MRSANHWKRWTALFCLFGWAQLTSSATIYTDKATYTVATTTAGMATFEDVAVGTIGSFVSGGVSLSGLRVDDNLVPGLPYSFWFGTMGSPTHFATMASGSYGNGFRATFPTRAVAAGFVFNCFGCDNLPNESALDWMTLDASGNVVEQGSVLVNFGVGLGQLAPGFLGLIASVPFRSLSVVRRSVVHPALESNWMADDVRYTAAPDLPTAAIPTLSVGMLLLTGLALLTLALVGFRQKRTGSD